MLVANSHDTFSGICPFGGFIILDGYIHVGTFCEDGTYSLPIGHDLNFLTTEVSLIQYSVAGVGEVSFSVTISLSIDESGMINPCLVHEQILLFSLLIDDSNAGNEKKTMLRKYYGTFFITKMSDMLQFSMRRSARSFYWVIATNLL